MRKEWKEFASTFFSRKNLQAGVWPVFLICIAFGVYEPLRLGPGWLHSPIMVFSISVLIPFVVVGFISPYSFVGERQRGTLEPLLATPVSDRAILFGKIGMAFLYGWGVSMATMLLGVGSIDLIFSSGRVWPILYGTGIPAVVLSLFISLLVALVGTTCSFYAKTILDAQRDLVVSLLIPILLPAFLIGPLAPGEWKIWIIDSFAWLGGSDLLLLLIVLLLITDAIFMVIAATRFHRNRLLLV
jgi:ABC-2 type transport system permease protein